MKNIDQPRESAEVFEQIMQRRRSVRGFLADEVNADLLKRIFAAAAYAPSNCNTQPWQLHVVSGARRDRISRLFLDSVGEGKTSLDFPYEAKYHGEHRKRQLDVGLMLYRALGVSREDKAGKRRAFLRNLEFFDAPHVVFVFMYDWCGVREAADVGMYAQNLMLAMRAHGVASCPQTILGYNADMVRAELNIDSNQKLLFGISFGYADEAMPENQIEPGRASLDESVHFYSQI